MTRINPLSATILAAFTAFLLIFIVSLCIARSEDRLAACDPLASPRVSGIASQPARTAQAIRIAFADDHYCPPRTALR